MRRDTSRNEQAQKSAARQAQRATGRPRFVAHVTEAHPATADHQAAIHALPLDVSQWQPLQVLDPADPNFGTPYYLADYSDPASGDIMR